MLTVFIPTWLFKQSNCSLILHLERVQICVGFAAAAAAVIVVVVLLCFLDERQ